MSINEKSPDLRELKPRITVFGVGGAGGNAVNNMIRAGLQGVDFVVANTDVQALAIAETERIIQMGVQVTAGLGAGSRPDVGRAAAEEVLDEISAHLSGAHMVFITAGMGGGTGSGASPVVARAARETGILTVGVVTKPFHFEGERRMRIAEQGIAELRSVVDTLIIIPNQNLFRIANEKTTFADAFAMADQVLYSGIGCITDLMVKPGLINLDFADVRAVMREMGKAMMGTGEATGENRASQAAEAAIANPLIYDVSMKGARGLLISISGGSDLTLFEVDEAATRIREEADPDANIIVGAAFDESLDGTIRVSVVATGVDRNVAMTNSDQVTPIETPGADVPGAYETRIAEFPARLNSEKRRIAHSTAAMAPEVAARGLQHRRISGQHRVPGDCGGRRGAFRGRRPGYEAYFAKGERFCPIDACERRKLQPIPTGSFHSGATRAGRPPAAHAAHRRAANSGTERDPRTRRTVRFGTGGAPHDPAADLGGHNREEPEADAKPSLTEGARCSLAFAAFVSRRGLNREGTEETWSVVINRDELPMKHPSTSAGQLRSLN